MLSPKAEWYINRIFIVVMAVCYISWILYILIALGMLLFSAFWFSSASVLRFLGMAVASLFVALLCDWGSEFYRQLLVARKHRDMLEKAVRTFISQDVADAELSRSAEILFQAYEAERALQAGGWTLSDKYGDEDSRAHAFRNVVADRAAKVAAAKKAFWKDRFNLMERLINYLDTDASYGAAVSVNLEVKPGATYSDYLPGSEYLESKKPVEYGMEHGALPPQSGDTEGHWGNC